MTVFLSLVDVLHIHRDLIERYGGSHAVRDIGLLDAALARAQSGYYGDVLAQAAALWESLSQNHPFIDGLYEAGRFTAAVLEAWLRDNVAPTP